MGSPLIELIISIPPLQANFIAPIFFPFNFKLGFSKLLPFLKAYFSEDLKPLSADAAVADAVLVLQWKDKIQS